MAQFRFMELEIWKESIAINDELFDLELLSKKITNFRKSILNSKK